MLNNVFIIFIIIIIIIKRIIFADQAPVSRDLLNSLMRAQDDETGIGLSSQELRDNVLTFMFFYPERR